MDSGTRSLKPQDWKHCNPQVLLNALRVRVASPSIDPACILIILAIATVFLAPALRPGYALLPLQWVSKLLPWSKYINEPLHNTTLGDPFFAFYPRRQFFTEAIRNGQMPFWNPYMLGGYPAVGDTNAQTFYPPNWLTAFLLSPARSFSLLAWFHLALTGVLMFGMLRSHRLHCASSLLGGISWMLSGILVVWLEHPHRLSSFAWLPGVFWAFNMGNRRRRPKFSVLAGILFALMILGGQPQYAGLGGLLLGLYALVHSLRGNGRHWHWDWWPLISLGFVAIIGLGLGSLQLLPTYEFTLQSHRQPRTMEAWLFSKLPLRHLTTFWLPNLFGSAEVGRYPYWGKLNYVEYTFYFGAFPFLLSLLAPLANRKNKIAWLWGLVTVLTVLTVLGSPLTHLAKWIPGMTYFSLHRMMSHIPFLGSWLAAVGFEALTERATKSDHGPWLAICLTGLVAATGVVLYACRLEARAHWDGIKLELLRQGVILTMGTLGLLTARRWHHLGVILVLAVTAIDLFLWGHTFNPVSSLDLLYPENDVTRWLKQDRSLYRVLPLRRGERIFGENVLSVFHISAPDGYLALTLRHHKELMYSIDPYFDEKSRRFRGPHGNLIVAQDFSPLHSLLNVKYVLSAVPLEAPSLHRAAVFHMVQIYRNPDVLSRAYVVHRARLLSRDETLDRLMSPDWDFHNEIMISEPLTPEQQRALDDASKISDSRVRITDYDPNRVQLTATMDQPGLVVLADPYSLGWRATVDGRPTKIYRANHAMRAVYVDAGEHEVEFGFCPSSLTTSGVTVMASCALALVLLTWSARHPPSAPQRQPDSRASPNQEAVIIGSQSSSAWRSRSCEATDDHSGRN